MTKILIDRSVLEQTLEALENTTPRGFNMERDKQFYAAIDSIRAALEQPEQEPTVKGALTVEQLVQALVDVGLVDSDVFLYPDGYQDTLSRIDKLHALLAALEQPEQDVPETGCGNIPVAWIESPHGAIRANPLYRINAPQSVSWSVPLYPHPPRRREWVGLTDEEIHDLSITMAKGDKSVNWLIGALEAKLREKNA